MLNRIQAETVRSKLLSELGSTIKGSGLVQCHDINRWAVSVIVDENDLASIPQIIDGVQVITKKTQKRT
jgi:hypothetical protein